MCIGIVATIGVSGGGAPSRGQEGGVRALDRNNASKKFASFP